MTLPETLLDDEILLVENGGEMPEVALHGCLYFLSHDPDGPGAQLADHELRRLHHAVLEGYRRIIVRDLTLANRGQRHYRGLARCLVNWRRLARFCRRQGLDAASVAAEVRALLPPFLVAECLSTAAARQPSCVNCSAEELLQLCQEVGLDPGLLPSGWQELPRCP